MRRPGPAAPASREATAERASHTPKWEPPVWFIHHPGDEIREFAVAAGRMVGAGDLSIHTGESLIYDAIAHLPGAPVQYPPYGPWRGSRFLSALIWIMRDTAKSFARELDEQAIAVRKAVGPILIGRGRSDDVLAAAQAAGPDLSPGEIEKIAAEESAWWLRSRSAA